MANAVAIDCLILIRLVIIPRNGMGDGGWGMGDGDGDGDGDGEE